jgi:LDH2 family malate/lactate/ureidoglycolate dehydrogenase
MVGIHFSSGGSTVAAPGGKGKLIGNNVCAIGAPGGRFPPFVLDMAPTMTVANRAKMLQWDGEPMPLGWVIDDAGRPVTDPARYFDAGSAVLPLGGTVDGGAHKGFGLLMVADIFSGMLSGDGGSLLRRMGAESHFCGALRIDSFVPIALFHSLMEQMAEKLHQSPSLDASERLRYPGEGSDRLYRERKAKGLPLHPRLVEELRSLGQAHGVALDIG